VAKKRVVLLADPETDYIKVDGKRVGAAERLVYIAMNKPKDYISTVMDPEGRPTVMDLLRGVKARVYPLGRLDYSSEGVPLSGKKTAHRTPGTKYD
jgi:16S rRNA U516 pseudouridylate synthase RsuA-like enzyme